MPNAENGILKYEGGQTLVSMVALTDSDHTVFNSADARWSNRSGYEADVKPDGLATGGAVTPAISGTNDLIDTAALTCYLAGVLTSVAASTDETILRGTGGDTYRKNSVQVDSAGAIDIVSGTDHTAFSDVRAATGGPPLILTGSIEIAQVHTASVAAAAITAAEIKQVPGTHVERCDFPAWTVDRQRVSDRIAGLAGINFLSALPLSHTGPVAKKVYAEYYTPDMAELPRSVDFVRPAESYSVNSTQVYGSTVGTSSKSLAGGGFVVHLNDGVGDNVLKLEGEILWFDFYPDRLLAPYVSTQGKLGVIETYPADNSIIGTCTIAADKAGERIIA